MLFSNVTKSYTYFWKNLDHVKLGRFVCLKNMSHSFFVIFLLINKTLTVLVGVLCERSLVSTSAWVVCKTLLPCEQTHKRRFCPHGTCQGGQVLTQSLTLKPAQLRSQHSPAIHGEGGSAHLRLLQGDDFLPSYLQTFGHTCRSHSGKHCLYPLSCPGPWSSIRDLRN